MFGALAKGPAAHASRLTDLLGHCMFGALAEGPGRSRDWRQALGRCMFGALTKGPAAHASRLTYAAKWVQATLADVFAGPLLWVRRELSQDFFRSLSI